MRAKRINFSDSFYTAWTIATKDILDALKNKNTRLNLILMLGFVVMFYWLSSVRPFDKNIQVVLYDEGSSNLEFMNSELQDGYSVTFSPASSSDEMKRDMRYERFGLVLSPDFDQRIRNGESVTLDGYILWHQRNKVKQLESLYSQKFSELFGSSVKIAIGENFVIPKYDVDALSANSTIFYVILWGSLTVIPFLLMEEKQSKTLDALLVSPASPGAVVLGKAMAGLVLVLALSIWFFAFYWIYVSHWGFVIVSVLLTTLFSVGLGLIVGSIATKQQQLILFNLVIVVVLFLPALFAQEAFLNSTLRAVFPYIPSSVLTKLLYLSFTDFPPLKDLLILLSIAISSIALIIAVVVWQVRRSDR